MKYILLLINVICVSFVMAQTPGVAITTSGNNTYASLINIPNGSGPFTFTWSGPNGTNSCNNATSCYIDTEEPGRYCITVESNNLELDEECEHGYVSVTECIDIEGSTCEDTNGDFDQSSTHDCTGSTDGWINFTGDLPDCMNGNAIYQWTNGEGNNTPQDIPLPTGIDGLSPGKYCVKITAFDKMDGECDCTAYYCAEIKPGAEFPLTVDAIIKPVQVCTIPEIGFVIPGRVTLEITGGLPNPDYNIEWMTQSSNNSSVKVNRNELTQCVKVWDDCNTVYKCFTVPIRYSCFFPPTDTFEESEMEISFDSSSGGKLRVFPNPASSNVSIQFEAEESSPSLLSIISPSGSILVSEQIQIEKGDNHINKSVGTLEAGFYFLHINGYDTERLFIIK